MDEQKYSERQIALILRHATQGARVDEVCKEAGISLATYHRWRKKYGDLMPSEAERLNFLEDENRRLKSMVADLSLTKDMLQSVIRVGR